MNKKLPQKILKSIGTIGAASILSLSLFACASSDDNNTNDNSNKNTNVVANKNSNKNTNDNEGKPVPIEKNTNTEPSTPPLPPDNDPHEVGSVDIDIDKIPIAKQPYTVIDSFSVYYNNPDVENSSPFVYHGTNSINEYGNTRDLMTNMTGGDLEPENIMSNFTLSPEGLPVRVDMNNGYSEMVNQDCSYSLDETDTQFILTMTRTTTNLDNEAIKDGNIASSIVTTYKLNRDGVLESKEVVSQYADGDEEKVIYDFDENGILTKIDYNEHENDGEDKTSTVTLSYSDDALTISNSATNQSEEYSIQKDPEGRITQIMSQDYQTIIDIHYQDCPEANVAGYINSIDQFGSVINGFVYCLDTAADEVRD